uniref:unspecific monooxygenase n=1 Tax=Chelonoidis abingdonii TaxID=106734 RepID=A0A8C0GDY9_CHEAB
MSALLCSFLSHWHHYQSPDLSCQLLQFLYLPNLVVFLVICISSLLFLLAWRKMSGSGKLPPGPVAFPIIEDTLLLNMKNFAKYGPIFTIHLGSERVVVLCGYEIMKESLIGLGEEFSGRGSMPIFEKSTKGRGINFSNGEQWKQLRRFSLTNLRNFGMGKKSIEECIQEETCFLMERLRNTHGGDCFMSPSDPTLFLTHALSNVICSTVFGDWFDYEDKKFVTLISLIQENDKLQHSLWTALHSFFPTLMDYIPGPYRRIFKKCSGSLDPNYPQDFIDVFLIKMGEQKNIPSEFNVESLARSAIELFVGGTGTTSITMKFGLLILLKYPEIEEKIHKEINCVIGQRRSPCMVDQSQMPYTDAVVHEIQRVIALVPLGVSRAVARDVHLKQYVIPKGTTIFPALKSVLYNSREFPNPEQFNLRHFLDENDAFKKSDFFMPFSVGKRICVGEGLARVELFLVLTTILQNCTIDSKSQVE